MHATTAPHTVWVCWDCYWAHHGLEDESGHTPDREPLCLIGEELEVTSGLMRDEHECDGSGEECGCESLTFTWSACDGCGSTLGGGREALTVWEVAR